MEIIPDITYTSQLTLSILFWGMAFIQLFWLLFFYLRIASHKEITIENKDLLVSIIIASRNEADYLYDFVRVILEQYYTTFAVIVVNQQSADNTAFIVKAYRGMSPDRKVIIVK